MTPSACFALDTWEKDLIAKFGVRFHRQMCHLQIMHVIVVTQIAVDKHLGNHLNRIAVDTTLAHLFPSRCAMTWEERERRDRMS